MSKETSQNIEHSEDWSGYPNSGPEDYQSEANKAMKALNDLIEKSNPRHASLGVFEQMTSGDLVKMTGNKEVRRDLRQLARLELDVRRHKSSEPHIEVDGDQPTYAMDQALLALNTKELKTIISSPYANPTLKKLAEAQYQQAMAGKKRGQNEPKAVHHKFEEETVKGGGDNRVAMNDRQTKNRYEDGEEEEV